MYSLSSEKSPSSRCEYQPRPARDCKQPSYPDQDDKAKAKRTAAPTKPDPELLPKISQFQVSVEPPLIQPTPELFDEPLRPRVLRREEHLETLTGPVGNH